MKKLLTGLLISVALAFSVNATTYTQSSGTSWGTSNATSQTHSVTVREGTTLVQVRDTAVGGLGVNECGSACNKADNIVTEKQRIFTKTNLVIVDTGNSQTAASSTSCFSGINVNGLDATEAHGSSSSVTTGKSFVTAKGTVVKKTNTDSTSTNNGAEYGSSSIVSVDTTTIDEKTNNIFSSGNSIITFTSTIGE